MAIKEFMILSVNTIFLIVLIGVTVLGAFLDLSITGKVVSIEPDKTMPSGLNLVALLTIITIITLVILNVNLKILAKLSQ